MVQRRHNCCRLLNKRALAMERQGNAKADELGNAKADEQGQDEQKKAVAQDASADAKMSSDTVDVPLGSVLGRLGRRRGRS